jgi:glyoxylase-like metal-dependent hydrolase (beta-lactamase superfamily II)
MDVTRVPVDTPTRGPGGRTNAYLLGRDDALLVDPADRSPDLDAAVADADVSAIAVTHHHHDHVNAVTDYAAETGAAVWVRAGRAAAFADVADIQPDRTFREGAVIDTDTGAIEVLATSGHAPGHVAFAWDEGAAVGDLAVAAGSVVVGRPEGDMRAYITALRRLRARGYDRLYPGHGPVIEEPATVLERLIAHRLDREAKIRAAVEGGARDLDEVLAAAYDKDLSGVRDLARATVACHLQKLAVEGDLQWDGERATPA